ncbi:hypothetical protein JCM1841_002432 [Sporobolomyces salmonicolor]
MASAPPMTSFPCPPDSSATLWPLLDQLEPYLSSLAADPSERLTAIDQALSGAKKWILRLAEQPTPPPAVLSALTAYLSTSLLDYTVPPGAISPVDLAPGDEEREGAKAKTMLETVSGLLRWLAARASGTQEGGERKGWGGAVVGVLEGLMAHLENNRVGNKTPSDLAYRTLICIHLAPSLIELVISSAKELLGSSSTELEEGVAMGAKYAASLLSLLFDDMGNGVDKDSAGGKALDVLGELMSKNEKSKKYLRPILPADHLGALLQAGYDSHLSQLTIELAFRLLPASSRSLSRSHPANLARKVYLTDLFSKDRFADAAQDLRDKFGEIRVQEWDEGVERVLQVIADAHIRRSQPFHARSITYNSHQLLHPSSSRPSSPALFLHDGVSSVAPGLAGPPTLEQIAAEHYEPVKLWICRHMAGAEVLNTTERGEDEVKRMVAELGGVEKVWVEDLGRELDLLSLTFLLSPSHPLTLQTHPHPSPPSRLGLSPKRFSDTQLSDKRSSENDPTRYHELNILLDGKGNNLEVLKRTLVERSTRYPKLGEKKPDFLPHRSAVLTSTGDAQPARAPAAAQQQHGKNVMFAPTLSARQPCHKSSEAEEPIVGAFGGRATPEPRPSQLAPLAEADEDEQQALAGSSQGTARRREEVAMLARLGSESGSGASERCELELEGEGVGGSGGRTEVDPCEEQPEVGEQGWAVSQGKAKAKRKAGGPHEEEEHDTIESATSAVTKRTTSRIGSRVLVPDSPMSPCSVSLVAKEAVKFKTAPADPAVVASTSTSTSEPKAKQSSPAPRQSRAEEKATSSQKAALVKKAHGGEKNGNPSSKQNELDPSLGTGKSAPAEGERTVALRNADADGKGPAASHAIEVEEVVVRWMDIFSDYSPRGKSAADAKEGIQTTPAEVDEDEVAQDLQDEEEEPGPALATRRGAAKSTKAKPAGPSKGKDKGKNGAPPVVVVKAKGKKRPHLTSTSDEESQPSDEEHDEDADGKSGLPDPRAAKKKKITAPTKKVVKAAAGESKPKGKPSKRRKVSPLSDADSDQLSQHTDYEYPGKLGSTLEEKRIVCTPAKTYGREKKTAGAPKMRGTTKKAGGRGKRKAEEETGGDSESPGAAKKKQARLTRAAAAAAKKKMAKQAADSEAVNFETEQQAQKQEEKEKQPIDQSAKGKGKKAQAGEDEDGSLPEGSPPRPLKKCKDVRAADDIPSPFDLTATTKESAKQHGPASIADDEASSHKPKAILSFSQLVREPSTDAVPEVVRDEIFQPVVEGDGYQDYFEHDNHAADEAPATAAAALQVDRTDADRPLTPLKFKQQQQHLVPEPAGTGSGGSISPMLDPANDVSFVERALGQLPSAKVVRSAIEAAPKVLVEDIPVASVYEQKHAKVDIYLGEHRIDSQKALVSVVDQGDVEMAAKDEYREQENGVEEAETDDFYMAPGAADDSGVHFQVPMDESLQGGDEDETVVSRDEAAAEQKQVSESIHIQPPTTLDPRPAMAHKNRRRRRERQLHHEFSMRKFDQVLNKYLTATVNETADLINSAQAFVHERLNPDKWQMAMKVQTAAQRVREINRNLWQEAEIELASIARDEAEGEVRTKGKQKERA